MLYLQGPCESYKYICNKYGTPVYFKGGQTLKNLLASPKDKDTITKKSTFISWCKCDKIECEDEYIGESFITFGERYKEHLKVPSHILEHYSTTFDITTGHFKIIGMEGHMWLGQ